MGALARLQPSLRVTIAFDDARQARADFRASRKTERQFTKRLNMVAEKIGQIVRDMADGSLASAIRIGRLMAVYSETISPWAEAVVARMHKEVVARDQKQWEAYAAEMGRGLRQELSRAPAGEAVSRLMAEQVTLIKSMPIEAARRVHELTMQNVTEGIRGRSLIDEIMRTGNVTRSRAKLIARTEVARTASLITQARAQHIGCTHYIWRTARDANVRPSHRKLDGRTFDWNSPPECDPGHHAHPGQIWNCRCWAEPVLPSPDD